MLIAEFIVYFSMGIWLLPVIRQSKGNYFYYFLILALADPVSFFSLAISAESALIVHSLAGILLFYSIGTNKEKFVKLWIPNVLFIIIFLVSLFFVENLSLVLIVLHSLVLYKFVKQALIRLHDTGNLNLFYLVLIFYELTTVLKLIIWISGTETGFIYVYLTLAFQILVAIFFTIFREDSSLLTFRLRTAP